jgi:hypothetical protein
MTVSKFSTYLFPTMSSVKYTRNARPIIISHFTRIEKKDKEINEMLY